MSTTELTIEEMAESLTGFEEIAIQNHFNAVSVAALLEKQPTMGIRALIFTDHHRRAETNVQQSRTYAMELTMKQAMEYFAEPPEELDDDDPDSPEGKGDSQPD